MAFVSMSESLLAELVTCSVGQDVLGQHSPSHRWQGGGEEASHPYGDGGGSLKTERRNGGRRRRGGSRSECSKASRPFALREVRVKLIFFRRQGGAKLEGL